MAPTPSSPKKYYTYILECGDGSLYTGYTVDLDHRIKMHNAGKGAKYTKSRLPVTLRVFWVFQDKSDALRLEAYIKQLSRKAKWQLIRHPPAGRPLLAYLEKRS